jgi:hypothetical protein
MVVRVNEREPDAEQTHAPFHTRIVAARTCANVLLETQRGSMDRYERFFGMSPKQEKHKSAVER